MLDSLRIFRRSLGLLLLASAALGAEKFPDYARAPITARVAAAYKAKILCSAVFVSKRAPADVEKEELRRFPLKATVDRGRRRVTVEAGYGQPDQIAVYRPGLGCTAAIDYTLEHIESQSSGRMGEPDAERDGTEAHHRLWPEGEAVSVDEHQSGIDLGRLDLAVARAFAEPAEHAERAHRGTRAVVVVYEGRIVAERYAPGFTKDTPLIGWSMAKSVTNALVGILVGEGRLSLESDGILGEWRGPGDPRRAITLEMLLTMTSGLDFEENYEDLLSDTPFMLSGTPDSARFAAAKPLREEPGKSWRYISGSPNIVCRILRQVTGSSLEDYFSFPRRALFDRIGMKSAVMEPDASGTFVGSSYVYATARDWARFGLLYLRDGVWGNERILPPGWVRFSTTPVPAAPRGEYGAYWWLNAGKDGKRMYPRLPKDLYLAIGYEGQNVVVVPSADLVVVHLGASDPPTEVWSPEGLVGDVLAALK